MVFSPQIPTPLKLIENNLFKTKELKVYIKRDDLIHPEVSGNKWRKLKYHFLRAQQSKKETIVTFGGAHSNHIAAVAAFGKIVGVKTIGIIRGEELSPESNETLKMASQNGMQFEFISRSDYKLKDTSFFLNSIRNQYQNSHIIPEGGFGFDGMMGVAELVDEITIDFDYITVAVGTATTLAGISWQTEAEVVAYPVFKKFGEQQENLEALLKSGGLNTEDLETKCNKIRWSEYADFGGYAKVNQSLVDSIIEESRAIGISLDPIYTGKAWLAFKNEVEEGRFKEKSTIIFTHTGGLQGIPAIASKLGLEKW